MAIVHDLHTLGLIAALIFMGCVAWQIKKESVEALRVALEEKNKYMELYFKYKRKCHANSLALQIYSLAIKRPLTSDEWLSARLKCTTLYSSIDTVEDAYNILAEKGLINKLELKERRWE